MKLANANIYIFIGDDFIADYSTYPSNEEGLKNKF